MKAILDALKALVQRIKDKVLGLFKAKQDQVKQAVADAEQKVVDKVDSVGK